MKLKITLIVLLVTLIGYSQTGINYKAILKDDLGNVIDNTFMNVQFSIHQTTSTGTIVYQEDHNYTTDANGLVILNIGTDPSPTVGLFSAIDWNADLHFLQTSITYSGGTLDFDATQFMTVPYAKHAETADNVTTKIDDLSDGKSDSNGYSLFIGIDAGLNDDGSSNENVGIGFNALMENITGSHNTAIGSQALLFNTSGVANTAIGQTALRLNTSGARNTAIGDDALQKNSSGNDNTAIGDDALEDNTTGSFNTVIGEEAMERNIGGHSNTALGKEALQWNTTGNGNIAIGINAGLQNSTGLNNIFLGNGSGSTVSVSNKLYIRNLIYGEFDTDLVRINGTFEIGGSLSIEDESDATSLWRIETRPNGSLSMYRNGDYRGFFSESTGNYSSISDRRAKKDITVIENGTLNKVMQLNPVSYLMKDQNDSKRNLGLISQEVQEIFPTLTTYIKEQDLITLSYTELIPILIKALQEQQVIIENQNSKIEAQNIKLDTFENYLNVISNRLENLEVINKTN